MTDKGYFTAKLSALTRFIESIAAIATECRLHIGTKTISTIVVDTANVAMVDVQMRCEGRGTATLGVDISALHNAFRKIKELAVFEGDTPVKVSWYPGQNTPFLEMKIECPFEYRMQFETLKEETIRKDPSRPTIALKSGFTCDGDDLYNGVRFCSVFGERCRIQTAKNGTVYLSGKEDTRQTRQNRIELSPGATIPAQTLYSAGDGTNYYGSTAASGATVPAQSLYSIDYLKDIAKALAGSSVTVQFDTDFPISLSAEVFPGISVRYLLAPRIEAEEDVGAWLE